jgi:hypothetical protein
MGNSPFSLKWWPGQNAERIIFPKMVCPASVGNHRFPAKRVFG